jgi:hypothetical protein
MKWFTCIVNSPEQICEVQLFWTRAETAEEAGTKAVEWCRLARSDGAAEEIDCPYVFDGNIRPVMGNGEGFKKLLQGK